MDIIKIAILIAGGLLAFKVVRKVLSVVLSIAVLGFLLYGADIIDIVQELYAYIVNQVGTSGADVLSAN